MIKKLPLTAFFIIFMLMSAAAQQVIQSKFYPKDIFRYPLNLPPSTAGSFGELRPNHFHSGLDFKTNQRTGYPLHAVLDGYVSRLRIQYGGYGRAVYITHPNGYTSVYGHLDRFSPEIEKVIREYQQKEQSYVVDFRLPPLTIQLVKGQVFAWSGNAGASAGPHLHFEIRDTQTEQTINPQLFGLTIPDEIPPILTGIATYHFAEGQPFSEKVLPNSVAVVGGNGAYRLSGNPTLRLSGRTGFGLVAYDMNSASYNHIGLYSIELLVDSQKVYTFTIERFGFDQTHAINGYIDYPTYLRSRRMIQKCFVPPGANLPVYPQSVNGGIVNFSDSNVHHVQYVVKDIAGNTSTLSFNVQASPSTQAAYVPEGTIFDCTKPNQYGNDKMKLLIEPGNLYNNIDFNYQLLPRKPGALSETHRIHNKFTPIHSSFTLWIKPDRDLGKLADKAVLVSVAGNVAAGTYDNGFIKGECGGFGDYYIKLDTVAPLITPVNIRSGGNMAAAKSINLRMSDNLAGIRKYSGTIDGQWVLIEHDYKTKLLRYFFDNNFKKGKHTFELTVTDNVGNEARYSADFYR